MICCHVSLDGEIANFELRGLGGRCICIKNGDDYGGSTATKANNRHYQMKNTISIFPSLCHSTGPPQLFRKKKKEERKRRKTSVGRSTRIKPSTSKQKYLVNFTQITLLLLLCKTSSYLSYICP